MYLHNRRINWGENVDQESFWNQIVKCLKIPTPIYTHTAQKNTQLKNKLKERFANTSDLNGEKYHAGYLSWYGLGYVLGMKGCHIVWWSSSIFLFNAMSAS